MNDEFILTNRIGGYSSYDLTRGHTRKYHGLLVAGVENVERKVVLATINEELETPTGLFNFAGNYYLNQRQPASLNYLQRAFFLPYPTQVYKIGDVLIRKELSLEEANENTVQLSYYIASPISGKLKLEPLVTLRDFHDIGLSLTNVEVITSQYEQNINLGHNAKLQVLTTAKFEAEHTLSEDHYYPLEAERGYAASEDLYKVGKYSYDLQPGQNKIIFIFSLKTKPLVKRLFTVAQDIITPSDNISIATDISRFHTVYCFAEPNFAEFLVYNARKFIIKDDKRYSLIAGYHWFGEWSRDTFIAFKGILLGLGHYHEAQRVLIDWGKYIAVGLLPNQMQGMHFNSLDGILWYINAIWDYYQETKDKDTIMHLLPKLERAIYALARGTKYGIGLNDKGFLIWTDETKALTWMDAIVDNQPVVQRTGAAVEIQSLWYNALQVIEHLAKETNYRLVNLALFDQLEKLMESNFHSNFWLSSHNYYADFIGNDNAVNNELRPNQLALYALPFTLGDPQTYAAVIGKIEAELLTPVGLRTLAPSSSQFIANYGGDQRQRDLAYHQGIIWPWLLKLYYQAISKYEPNQSQAKIVNHLTGVWDYFKTTNMLTVPELFSNDQLKPGGALNQAWSVAALIEGVMLTKTAKT